MEDEPAQSDDFSIMEKSTIAKRYKFNIFRETLFDKYYNKMPVHCADLSRNNEFLVCGCSKVFI